MGPAATQDVGQGLVSTSLAPFVSVSIAYGAVKCEAVGMSLVHEGPVCEVHEVSVGHDVVDIPL